MAESIELLVEFSEGEEVFFKQDQEKMWVVVGFEIRDNHVAYIVATPEHGEQYATKHELITERTLY